MGILGVVGSPRKDGLTSQLLGRALEGASSTRAQVSQAVFSVGYDVQPWTESRRRGPEELEKTVAEAEAVVLGSPVYYMDVSGLMRDFMDHMQTTLACSESTGDLLWGSPSPEALGLDR